MNINSLSTPMMLNLTDRWLADAEFRSSLESVGPIGAGMLAELDAAHGPLAELESNRSHQRGELRELTDLAAALDLRHDSKARGLHHLLRGLIELADDDATVVQRRKLLDLLFPTGLTVTRLPYIEQGGSAVALERTVKPEIRAQLAAITVGDQTLAQVFDAWMAAAHELARTVKRRAELIAQTRPSGSDGEALDGKAGRSQWIRAVRGLLWVLESKPELRLMREAVIAVLERSLATARRRLVAPNAVFDAIDDDVTGALEDVDEATGEATGEDGGMGEDGGTSEGLDVGESAGAHVDA
jgi:hypothetical protein